MKLKKWVKVLLTIIALISFMVMASENESTTAFVISHLIACGVFALSTTTLIKYAE